MGWIVSKCSKGFFIDQQMWHQAAPASALEGAIIRSATQLWSLVQDTCWTFQAWVGVDLNTLIQNLFWILQANIKFRLTSHLLQIPGVLGKSRLHAGEDLVHLVRRVDVPQEDMVRCCPYQIYSNITNIAHILNILNIYIWPNIVHIWCWLS